MLLYLQDLYASVTRPVKELKALARVSLAPHEKRSVRLELAADAFSLLDRDMKRRVEPGEFRLSVCPEALARSVWVR